MPATFNLELSPGQLVALDTTISSDELDMARMEDGTTVDGQFWGKLTIVHDGDRHDMEFSGTRIISDDVTPDLLVDSRVIAKLATASKPATAKCHLSILAPSAQYCDVTLSCSSLWKLGMTWPTAELIEPNKVKYFLRVHPGGAAEHFETNTHCTALYYEAMYATSSVRFNGDLFTDPVILCRFPSRPDPEYVDPNEFIAPRNGFAMTFQDFIPHLSNVCDQLGMSLHARTNFIK
jgi:hypothetical protein